MGMFNNVKCEMPLPELPTDGRNFQTKSLYESNCDQYIIQEDGQIIKHAWHSEKTGRWYLTDVDQPIQSGDFYLYFTAEEVEVEGFVELSDAEYFDTLMKNRDDPELAYIPRPEYTRVDDGFQPVDFTGEFSFYTHKGPNDWLEYVATCENGKVINIRRDYDREWRINNMRA